MADKKNIKIKVRYPTSGSKPEKDLPAPRMIKVWNVKRILLALGCVVLVLVSMFFFMKDDAQKTDLQPEAALSEKIDVQKTDLQAQAALSEKTGDASAKSKTGINKNVQRALLTYKIHKNEPVGEIRLPLKISNKKPVKIYYFVELAGMKGQTVYHEWLLDGSRISRKKIKISADLWRSSSRQIFYYTAKHNWTVRVVDETGQIINEKHFDVIFE
jgi:hypothetical protein